MTIGGAESGGPTIAIEVGDEVTALSMGGRVTPNGKKYTSSMNTLPPYSGVDGGNASSASGLNLYENMIVCSPGGRVISTGSKASFLITCPLNSPSIK
jgi:hypothetical protein